MTDANKEAEEEESSEYRRSIPVESQGVCDSDGFLDLRPDPVESYCAHFGRERIRRYLLPTGSKPLVFKDNIEKSQYTTELIAEKSHNTSMDPMASSRSDDSFSEFTQGLQDDGEIADVSTNKAVSPPSSVTSRKLEWDSLADIGYANAGKSDDSPGVLSTIERMALENQHKKEITLSFNDKNLFKGCLQLNYTSLGTPNAQSTPTFESNIKKSSIKHSNKNSKPSTMPDKYIKSKVHYSKKTIVTRRKRNNSKIYLKKKSSVSVDVDKSYGNECLHPQFTKTHLSDPKNDEDRVEIEKKGSSSCESSVNQFCEASVTSPSPEKNEPSIIISDIKDSSLEKSVESSKSFSPVKISPESVNDICMQKNDGIFCEVETASISIDDNNINDNKSVLSKADSFEFMPGHIFEEKFTLSSIANEKSKKSPIVNIDNDIISTNNNPCDNEYLKKQNLKIAPVEKHFLTKFSNIEEIVKLRHHDPNVQKRLIKKIVNLLLTSDTSTSNSSNRTVCDDRENQVLNVKGDKSNYQDVDCQTEKLPSSITSTISKSEIITSAKSNIENFSNSIMNKNTVVIDKCCQTSPNSSSSLSEYYKNSNISKESLKIKPHKKISRKDLSDKFPSIKIDEIQSNISSEIQCNKNLNAINNEILKLLIMKFKLENKENFKAASELNSNDSKNIKNTSSSGQQSFGVDLSNSNTISLPSYDKSGSNISIPPLNLKSSSENSNQNSEDLLTSIKKLSTQNKYLKPDSKYNVEKLSAKSSKEFKNSKPPSSDNKMDQLEDRTCSSCNYSKSSSDINLCDDRSGFDEKLSKLKENYSKYKKCKIMRAFLQDYDALIKKYQQMKIISAKSKPAESHLTPINLDHNTTLINSDNISTKLSSKMEDNTGSPSKTKLTPLSSSYNKGSRKSSKSATNEKNESNDIEITTLPSKKSENSLSQPKNEKQKCHNILEDKDLILQNLYSLMKKFEERLNLSQNKINNSTQMPSSLSSRRSNNSLKNHKNLSDQNINDVYPKDSGVDNKSLCIEEYTNTQMTSKVESSSNERMCHHCKKNVLKKTKSKCSSCLKNDIRDIMKLKKYPKPIAYNLVLQQSDSFTDLPIPTKTRKTLDQVIIKVPSERCKNNPQLYKIEKDIPIICDPHLDSVESTDEQLKEFSSLNDDNLSILSDPLLKIEFYEDSKKKTNHNLNTDEKKSNPIDLLTVRNYLEINRPKFIDNANERQRYIKEFHFARKEYESKRRKFLEKDLSNILLTKKELNNLNHNKILMPENKKIFNAKETVKNTARRYRSLPEVVKKKEMLKEQRHKKTNKLMSKIFVKKLRQKALNGIVNIPYNSDIISL